ncbi:terpene synthase family protein [Kitasatospora sp. LaBMicrA B282]|uniref:terpene synthase family protein n=1 Tax=Kitasatospora sp. LaBMicrA B282 TaxID=3420949 RepID=UPI003D0C1582
MNVTLSTGPTGIGTRSARAHLRPGDQPVRPIPGLYWHPVAEPEPTVYEELDRRLKRWAVDDIALFPPEWEEQFDSFGTGRYMCLTYPDAASLEHLEAAGQLMVAENAVDDCYCEDHGGSPHGLGARLLMAHSALERPHSIAPYEQQWQDKLESEAPCRAYRSSMESFDRISADQVRDREIHDLARLHLGYLAEASWSIDERVPPLSEYLMVRQYNSFRPCLSIVDAVAGYAFPADLHDHSKVQQVIALAALATTLVNDLYSYTKELRSPRPHVNLPTVIGHHDQLPPEEAYDKAITVHNDVMHRFEAESAACLAELPGALTARYLKGIADWVDGDHWWHATNTGRYTLPGWLA